MSLKNLALPIFLIVFLGLGFSQTAPKAAKTAPKPTTAQTASPKPKAEPKQEEREIIPPADPNALFPAVVAKVNGKSILGRDLSG